MRFRADQHLRRQRDIRVVREQGRRLDCGAFTLWYRRRPAANPSVSSEPSSSSVPPPVAFELRRVCVIASTAAVGHAVLRARAKRRLREVFRQHQQAIPPGYDLLLVARAALNQLEYREIERKFLAACQRIPPVPS